MPEQEISLSFFL